MHLFHGNSSKYVFFDFKNTGPGFTQPPQELPMDKAASSGIDFRLVPQELMPVAPIDSYPTSIQMYENHMEVMILHIAVEN